MISAAIIGLGKIGLTYDVGVSDDSLQVLTHTQACLLHPDIDLKAGVDSNKDARAAFKMKTGVEAYGDVSELHRFERIDLIIISTPANVRYSIIEKCRKFNPKAILVEKPIATTESEANEILTFCAENEINLGVNYFRNYDPVFVELINDIGDGRFGSFLFGNCVYSGGLLNNGSHYINLLNSFFGIPSSIHNDLFMDAQEPSGIGFQLGYGEAAVVFQELDVDYQLGEMELYFTRARVRLDHCCEKISVSTLERNKTFPTSQSLLENEIEAYRPNNDQYQYSVIEQVVRSMDADEPFSCSGREALETLRVCLRVRKHEE